MEHEPSGLLTDADVLSNLATADAVLAVQDHPHGGEPLVQRDSGIFHDGSDLDRELALGVVSRALPSAPFGVEADTIRPATGTNDLAVGPATQSQVINAVILVCKVDNSFLQAFWFWLQIGHNLALHALKCTTYLRASQVNNRPG